MSKTSKSINKKIRNNLKKKDKQNVINAKKEKVRERFINKYDSLLDNHFETYITGFPPRPSLEDTQEEIDAYFNVLFHLYGKRILITNYDELVEIFENNQGTIREYNVESRIYKNLTPGFGYTIENLELEYQYKIMENIAERLFILLRDYNSEYQRKYETKLLFDTARLSDKLHALPASLMRRFDNFLPFIDENDEEQLEELEEGSTERNRR